jgi:mannose-6-phosphate isomerase-like protein (cupin superfamily)
MDIRFEDIYNHPSASVFQVVFFPDRIYHAQYLNATRSERYRYNVQEVRTKADITVLKGEVYKDAELYTTFLRVEYRSARLVEAMRVKGRLQGTTAVRARIRLWLDTERRDLSQPQFLGDSDPIVRLYYCPWVDAFQVELWSTLELPEGDFHDIEVLTMMGRDGAITRVPKLAAKMMNVKLIREVDLQFLEDDITDTSGYYLPFSEVAKDDFYFRNLQVPNTTNPSDNRNTVLKGTYTLNFVRGFFLPDATQIAPVRYRNAMMMGQNPDMRDDNILEMRWLLQDEFSSSMVFFHEVAIPPGVVEGTHQHIGSEELYFVYEGEGVAYMGANDHPDLAAYPEETRHVFGLDPKAVRALPVKKGSVIFTKSGGIHGIKNTSADRMLRFVAFLYQSA